MKQRFKWLVVLAGLSFVYACGGGNSLSSGVSKTTGWKYNKAEYGGFEVKGGYEQPTPPGMVLIPGGTFTMGRLGQDVTFEWNNEPRRVSVDNFYMDATEVRNVDYREYINWLRLVYPSYPQVYIDALPDSLSWRKTLAYNEPLMEYYFRLGAFDEYPVVAVTWLQATNYCEWRSDRVNEIALIRHGILELNVLAQKDADVFTTDAYSLGLYVGQVKKNLPDITGRIPEGRPVRIEDGILIPKFRLPTEAEWEYGAVAQISDPISGQITDKGLYPWKGNRVRITSGNNSGRLMANFQKGRGDMMGLAGNNDGNAPTPLPVNTYEPNDFGLYCMAGNVNEWVMDIYRAMTSEDVQEFRPFRGNVFSEFATNEEGKYYTDSLGRVVRKIVPNIEGQRRNYTLGDVRNAADGDQFSLINTDVDLERVDSVSNSTKMYNSGIGVKRTGASSLITDNVRVYKGGSFRDRAYWLTPGARRFLDEAKSSEDLGFRCTMDRLGQIKYAAPKNAASATKPIKR
ncbi:gliding motility lipoprotein GldJ [Bacteroidia bacterium]|nr:gliding motility lipoprotein GldJ [Bacteroidia bacterium]